MNFSDLGHQEILLNDEPSAGYCIWSLETTSEFQAELQKDYWKFMLLLQDTQAGLL